jgi:hypothetical protein
VFKGNNPSKTFFQQILRRAGGMAEAVECTYFVLRSPKLKPQFKPNQTKPKKKKEQVLWIQHCLVVSLKSLQEMPV